MAARWRVTGTKYCSHCEREKPLSEFYLNTEGRPQGRCKICHRYASKLSFRRRYRTDPVFRARMRAKRVVAALPAEELLRKRTREKEQRSGNPEYRRRAREYSRQHRARRRLGVVVIKPRVALSAVTRVAA